MSGRAISGSERHGINDGTMRGSERENPGVNGRMQVGESSGGTALALRKRDDVKKGRRGKSGSGSAGAGQHVQAASKGAGMYRTRWIAWTFIAAAFTGCAISVVLRGGALEWFGLLLFGGVAIASGLLPLMAAYGMTAQRSLQSDAVVAGNDAAVYWSIKRAFRVPLVWMAIEDRAVNGSRMEVDKVCYRSMIVPSYRKLMPVSYTLHSLARGAYRFEPATIVVGDWLGLTAIARSIGQAGEQRDEGNAGQNAVQGTELIVLPADPQARYGNPDAEAAKKIRPMPTAGSRTTGGGGLAGQASHNPSMSPFGAAGIGPESRPYRDGDSLRSIDFRSAARGRGLHTKMHSNERVSHCVIAIDEHKEAYGDDCGLFDASIGYAAYQAFQHTSQGGTATIWTSHWEFALSPHSGSRHGAERNELLRMLAYVRCRESECIPKLPEKLSASMSAATTLQIYTGNWRNARNWTALAAAAMEHGCRVELYLATRSTDVSNEMLEQQRLLENCGVKTVWQHVAQYGQEQALAMEGGDSYAFG